VKNGAGFDTRWMVIRWSSQELVVVQVIPA
jgi:hypothetical protein